MATRYVQLVELRVLRMVMKDAGVQAGAGGRQVLRQHRLTIDGCQVPNQRAACCVVAEIELNLVMMREVEVEGGARGVYF